MKIKFLYIENGKITLTKKELEQLLEESYQDGVAEGRKSNNTYIPDTGKIATQPGNNDPYWYYPAVTCQSNGICSDNVKAVKVSGGDLDWTTAGTVTISGCCEADSTISAHVAALSSEVCGSTVHAYNTLYNHTDTSDIASITAVDTAEGK